MFSKLGVFSHREKQMRSENLVQVQKFSLFNASSFNALIILFVMFVNQIFTLYMQCLIRENLKDKILIKYRYLHVAEAYFKSEMKQCSKVNFNFASRIHLRARERELCISSFG